MDQVIKEKWVAALRDPGRKQIKSALNACGGMCCLGVLCDLNDSGMWVEKEFDDAGNPAYGHFGFGSGDQDTLPPIEVYRWAGLDVHTYLEIDGEASTPENHNDNGKTFAQIADAIEAQL